MLALLLLHVVFDILQRQEAKEMMTDATKIEGFEVDALRGWFQMAGKPLAQLASQSYICHSDRENAINWHVKT